MRQSRSPENVPDADFTCSFFDDVTTPVRVLRRFQDGVGSTARRSSNSQSPLRQNVKHLHLADKVDHHRDSRPRFLGPRGKAELGFRTNTRSSPLTGKRTSLYPARCRLGKLLPRYRSTASRPTRHRDSFGPPEHKILRAMRKLWSRKLRPWRSGFLSLTFQCSPDRLLNSHERKPLTGVADLCHYRCPPVRPRESKSAMP